MVSQTVMGVDSQAIPCPLCPALGRAGALILRQINIEEAIYVCSDNQCFYPIAVGSTETELIKRRISEWDEAEVIEQRLGNSTCVPSVVGHTQGKHPTTHQSVWQPTDPHHQPSHHTTASSHQLYGPNCPPHGQQQLPGSNHQSHDHLSAQSCQQFTHDPSHQTFSHFADVQGYAYDSSHQTFSSFGDGSHQPYNQTYPSYGWSGHPPGNQSWLADAAYLSYPSNQPDGDQQVDEMDSFIDSLFQS